MAMQTLLSSIAIQKINSTAANVLLSINDQLGGAERKRIDYNIIARKYGITWQTVSNTVDELIRRGILTATKQGLSINLNMLLKIDIA